MCPSRSQKIVTVVFAGNTTKTTLMYFTSDSACSESYPQKQDCLLSLLKTHLRTNSNLQPSSFSQKTSLLVQNYLR